MPKISCIIEDEEKKCLTFNPQTEERGKEIPADKNEAAWSKEKGKG